MEPIKVIGRMPVGKLRGGLLVRKPKPYSGYKACEWTRIVRIQRCDGQVYLIRPDGTVVDREEFDTGGGWSPNAVFEIGQEGTEEQESAARSAAITNPPPMAALVPDWAIIHAKAFLAEHPDEIPTDEVLDAHFAGKPVHLAVRCYPELRWEIQRRQRNG